MIMQLLLHSLAHIQPTGKLLFSFGDSGYKSYLSKMLRITPWDATETESSNGANDRVYVMELKMDTRYQDLLVFADKLIT